MADPTAPAAPASEEPEAKTQEPTPAREDTLVEADLLVEDVSIDGMCGVY